MMDFSVAIASFLMGGILVFLYLQKQIQKSRIREKQLEEEGAEARYELEGERRLFAEKERFLTASAAEMEKSFRALSNQALTQNTEHFLTIAKTALDKQNLDSASTLEKKEEAIKNLVHPMKEILDSVKGRMETIEKDYQKTFTEVREQFKYLKEDQSKLQLETANLVKALRAPQTRGRWGEIQLKRVVEMAGMLNYVDFIEQASTDTEGGKLRPDMLVKLPGKKLIVIDAKTSLAAYLEMIEATDDVLRQKLLKDHGRQIKDHINSLSSKSYWDQFPESPEFVIMFLPNEAIYGAALEAEPQLIELGASKNVIISTPTTLIALLKAVAYGWNQEVLAENAKKISVLGKELYDRMAVFVEHMDGVRKGLERSVDAYNRAVGTFESRVLPSTRRFKELGISTDKEIAEMEDIDKLPKELREMDS